MNVCKNCGQELRTDGKFCMNCGAPVDNQQTETGTQQTGDTGQNQYYATANQPYQAQPSTKRDMLLQYKYSMIKFKKILALVMMIMTGLAMIIGLIAIAPLNSSYQSATNHAESMSIISSQAGNTIAEAFYNDCGNFLEDSAAISYTTACILSGLYQTILLLTLLGWIYLFRKSSFEKKLFETTGEFE